MNSAEMKAAERPTRCDQGPSCVLVQIAAVYDWLYRDMIRELREAYGTRFIFLTRGDLWKDRYGDLLTEADTALDLGELETAKERQQSSDEEVYAAARRYELRYGIVYMRDIVQQERTIATRFLPSAPFFAVPPGQLTEQAALTRRINAYFAAFEDLLSRENVDLIFARPDSLHGVPLVAVATRQGIPTTFPDVAKYKGLVTWAHGAYRSGGLIRAVYEAIPQQAEPEESVEDLRYADKDFKGSGGAFSLARVARDILLTSVDRAGLILDSLRHGRWGRRTSYWTGVRRIVNAYRAARWLDRNSRHPEDIARTAYVLFLLPVEPEFNTHSLAREFCNSLAIVQQVALCLPAGYRLVVKEHGSNLGNRRLDYYRDLAKFPSIDFVDHRVPGTVLARGAAAVATISGTIGIEASLIAKPTIIFSTRTIYDFLPHIRIVTSMYDLPEALGWAIRTRSPEERSAIRAAGARFYAALQNVGFPAENSPLFKGDDRRLEAAARRRALTILLETYNRQRQEFAAAAKRNSIQKASVK